MGVRDLFYFCLLAGGVLSADEIRVLDGSVFKGTIGEVSDAYIQIETVSAGTLSVARDQVEAFLIDEAPATVVSEEIGVESAPVPAVVEVSEEVAPEPVRKWTVRAAGNMGGRSGNSAERWLGGDLAAIWAGDEDELKMSASLSQRESNGEKSSDERTFSMRYTSYFSDLWGWYVRQGFESDRFKNLQLRSMSAFGLSFRRKEKERKLYNLNLGLSYRHEQYVNDSAEGTNLGLDMGMEHFFGERGRFELHNAFTLVPSLENTGSYLLTQDSYMDIPLGDSARWKMRVGLRNDYNSQPSDTVDPLDSRYYSSLVAEWN